MVEFSREFITPLANWLEPGGIDLMGEDMPEVILYSAPKEPKTPKTPPPPKPQPPPKDIVRIIRSHPGGGGKPR